MFDSNGTNPARRPIRPRKIVLDVDLYRAHSVRASAGDVNCDHDFDASPTVTEADFAVWSCTRCGRSFRYESWKGQTPLAPYTWATG